MSKQPPPAPTASAVGPCPTLFQISRTPRHWKFTQHHHATRPPLFETVFQSILGRLPERGRRGWSGGAMVLGKLPVPGCPTIWITVGQGPTALAVGAGGGCLDIFTLIYPFFPLSPSLWETARYRLKYCLKGPLNPERGRKKREMIDERKNVQTTPTRTYCKRSRPLTYSIPNK